jgi:osmoprotectant transport system permease protein
MLSQHAYLALLPLVIGFLIALPLGVGFARSPGRSALVGFCALVGSIPALAWFVFLPGLTSTALSARVNILVGLTILTTVWLTEAFATALAQIPTDLREVAEALGFSPAARAWRIELPAALPGIISGVRTAAVATISLATLAALVGAGGLGRTLTEGFATRSDAEILSGTAVVVVLAMLVETVLVRLERVFAPWSRLAAVRTGA